MKKWVGILFVVVLMSAFASADTLTLTLPNSSAATPTGQTGPYLLALSVNGGSPTTVPMICYSEHNSITYGESWTVQAYTINTIGALAGQMFGAATAADTVNMYNLLGYLSDQLFANPGNSALQNAIWSILAGTCSTNSICSSTVVPNSYQTTDVFYIPVGTFTSATGYPYGIPQPFVAQTPEPGTVLLLGSGLLGLFGLRKKKFAA